MRRATQRGLSVTQLRLFLSLLFLALALPTAVLIVQTRRQIQWESFHQHQSLAVELATRIDADLQRVLEAEGARSYADYGFAIVAGDPTISNLVQRSPLAQFPVQSEIPGLLGYFAIDAAGGFSTPLLPTLAVDPAHWGVDAAEFTQRRALRDELLEILSRNQLLDRSVARDATDGESGIYAGPAPAPLQEAATRPVFSDAANASSTGQAAFDKLNALPDTRLRGKRGELGRVEDLPIEQNFDRDDPESSIAKQRSDMAFQQLRAPRKEQSAVPETLGNLSGNEVPARIRIFESEIDPFEFSLLDSGHGVLFRKVWRDGSRTIQGAILAPELLLERAIFAPFRATALAQMSDLVIAYDGDVLATTRAPGEYEADAVADRAGELLYRTRLSAPLGQVQLLWTINRLPAGAGARIVGWSSVVLFGVLVLGFLALYRLGLRQILLARQQQDFVSAVSHELKTPLTSIRMYAEMLREGWAAEERKRGYYEFIHDESERLSRLIANVLQLARMERNEVHLELKPIAVPTLMDMLRSRVHGQIERAGFEGVYRIDPACSGFGIEVDVDAFVQILINLVDNAIKFSGAASRRTIEIEAQMHGAQTVVWSVRDHGPGVPKAQMKRIFELFYRSGSELTRETVGTGIGLALVRQLAHAMHGSIDVINREPGAEFRLTMRCATHTPASPSGSA